MICAVRRNCGSNFEWEPGNGVSYSAPSAAIVQPIFHGSSLGLSFFGYRPDRLRKDPREIKTEPVKHPLAGPQEGRWVGSTGLQSASMTVTETEYLLISEDHSPTNPRPSSVWFWVAADIPTEI